jgi:hypothetical protein
VSGSRHKHSKSPELLNVLPRTALSSRTNRRATAGLATYPGTPWYSNGQDVVTKRLCHLLTTQVWSGLACIRTTGMDVMDIPILT